MLSRRWLLGGARVRAAALFAPRRFLAGRGRFTRPTLKLPVLDKKVTAPSPLESVASSKELSELIVYRLLSEKDARQLSRLLATIHSVPSTRMLVISRIGTQERPVLRWFSAWLWPYLHGTKSVSENMFPMQIPETMCGREVVDRAAEKLYEALWATNHTRRTRLSGSASASAADDAKSANIDQLQSSTRALAAFIVQNNPLYVCDRLSSYLMRLTRSDAFPPEEVLTQQLREFYSFHNFGFEEVVLNVGYSLPEKGNKWMATLKSYRRRRPQVALELQNVIDAVLANANSWAEQDRLAKQGKSAAEASSGGSQPSKGGVFKGHDEWGKLRGMSRVLGHGNRTAVGRTEHTLYVSLKVVPMDPSAADFSSDRVWQRNHLAADELVDQEEARGGVETGEVGPIISPLHPSRSSDDADAGNGDEASASAAAAAAAGAEEEEESSADAESLRYATHYNKIFLPNIPAYIDETDLARVLRHCGDVDRVWLYRVSSEGDVKESTDEDEDDEEENEEYGFDAEAGAEAEVGEENELRAAVKELFELDLPGPPGAGADDADDSEASLIHQSFARRVDGARATARESRVSKRAAAELAAENEAALGYVVATHPQALAPAPASSTPRKVSRPPKYAAKSRESQRKLPTIPRDDSHAFALFRDAGGYMRATCEDMRVFGVAIDRKVCRVFEARKVRTVIVELQAPMSVREASVLLNAALGFDVDYVLLSSSLVVPGAGSAKQRKRDPELSSAYSKVVLQCKPVFLHLEFPTHEAAWLGMSRLQGLAAGGAAIRPSWIKSGWYRTVAKKAREIEGERADLPPDALAVLGGAAGAGATKAEGEGDEGSDQQNQGQVLVQEVQDQVLGQQGATA